jgi:ferredoxin
MKPKIDQNLCIDCGTCVSICPEVFELGKDGKVHVKKGVDYKKFEETIRQAISSCPVRAIPEK